MKRVRAYITGAMIGIIGEYFFRINSGNLQALILIFLVVGVIIDVIVNFEE